MLGDSGVGKTSLVRQWVQHSFDPDLTKPTIGSAFSHVNFQYNGNIEKIQIWDTAGEEKYRAMAPIYSQNAFGAIIVFDMSRKETLEHVEEWMSCVPSNIPIVLAGNKCDLPNLQLSEETVFAFSEQFNFEVFFTSAASGLNVTEMFERVVTKAFECREETREKLSVEVDIDNQNSNESNEKSCC